jgi:deoxyuridine 5'-triphosphate nucleotidohydrolase
MSDNKLFVKKLSVNAVLPQKAYFGDAGFDLSSAHALIVPAYGKAIALTDLSMSIPADCYGRIAPRSSLASKNFIDIGAGVIDATFRNNIGILIFNHSENDFKIEVGDRIAQLIIEVIRHPEVVEVDELPKTDRGEGGFGSSGLKKFKK